MTRAGKRKWAWALGVLVVLAALPIALWLVLESSTVADRVRDRVQTQASERLGREVTIGSVETDVFPTLQILLRDFRVAGGPEEPELVQASAARVKLAWWPLLRSFGRDVRIHAFTLERPQVSLVKRADGSWSYEEVSEQLEQSSSATAEAEEAARPTELFVRAAAVEDGIIRVIDRTAKPEAVITLQRVSLQARDIGYERPLVVDGTASIGGKRQNVKGSLELDHLPRSFDRPEDWPQITARVDGDELPLQSFRGSLPAKLGVLIAGGLIDAELRLSTTAPRTFGVTGRVQVSAMRLRTGEATAGFNYATELKLDAPGGLQVSVSELKLSGPGVALGGKATVSTEPSRLRFALAGPLLDLDTVMDAFPPDAEGDATGGSGADDEDSREDEPLLSPELREKLAATDVAGTLKLERVRSGKLQVEALDAEASLKQGTLTLTRAAAAIYGGSVDLAGTTLVLTEAEPRWNLKASLASLELGTAMNALTGQAPVAGQLAGTLALSGEGNDWPAIRDAVTGRGAMTISDGSLAADLRQSLSGALVQGLQKIGRGALAGKVERAAKSELEKVEASFQLRDGWLVLSSPLSVATPFGAFTLGGRLGLDRALDLDGSVSLPPAFVATLTQGKWRPAAPIELPVAIGGTLQQPVVTAREPRALLQQLVTQEGKQRGEEIKRKAEQRVREEVERRTKGLFDRF